MTARVGDIEWGGTPPRIVVIYGGRSAEAEISVVSGSAIAAALIERGLDVAQVLIARSGRAALLPRGHRRDGRAPSEYTGESRAEALVELPFRSFGDLLRDLSVRLPDAVFVPALHGPGDESGEVQQLLDSHGLAFVGARPDAAALGMDKARFKDLAASLGLSRMFRDDLEQLEAGMLLYDAFFRWCRDATDEGHGWPTSPRLGGVKS